MLSSLEPCKTGATPVFQKTKGRLREMNMRKVSSQTVLQPVHPWPVSPCPGCNTSTPCSGLSRKQRSVESWCHTGCLQFLTRVAGGKDKQAEPLPGRGQLGGSTCCPGHTCPQKSRVPPSMPPAVLLPLLTLQQWEHSHTPFPLGNRRSLHRLLQPSAFCLLPSAQSPEPRAADKV